MFLKDFLLFISEANKGTSFQKAKCYKLDSTADTQVSIGRTPLQASGWTPLHQAVYMGASKDHITRLVRDFGALREAFFFSLQRTSHTILPLISCLQVSSALPRLAHPNFLIVT